MNILILGLGFGKLYADVISKAYPSWSIIGIDPGKNTHYSSIEELSRDYKVDLAIISVPNYLHLSVARRIVEHFRCVRKILVEKPGFKNLKEWNLFKQVYDKTELYLTKNNLYRNELESQLDCRGYNPSFQWMNHNRIPSPGSWFTNKQQSFGGVEKDLVPHLLSLVGYYLHRKNRFTETPILTSIELSRNHNLQDLQSTDYGHINDEGVFNVADTCNFMLEDIEVSSKWKYPGYDVFRICFQVDEDVVSSYNLGFCPSECYLRMVEDILEINVKFDYLTHQKFDNFIIYALDQLEYEG